jgi:hypothetical protein
MMRVYGRVTDPLTQAKTWEVVTTDANGFNDHVHLTALAQVLQLNLNESPFFANFGIPARESVLSQVAPDFYAAFTQQQYAQFFATLLMTKRPAERLGSPPTYDIQVITHVGVKLNKSVPIPI